MAFAPGLGIMQTAVAAEPLLDGAVREAGGPMALVGYSEVSIPVSGPSLRLEDENPLAGTRCSSGRLRSAAAVAAGLLLVAAAAWAEDPFGAPPKGVSPNCGPEHRYKFQQKIRSATDFASFLKQHAAELVDGHGNQWVRLDNFRGAPPEAKDAPPASGPVDWARVEKAVVVRKAGARTLYGLECEPMLCPGQHFTVRMTSDGHVSLYGCCGY